MEEVGPADLPEELAAAGFHGSIAIAPPMRKARMSSIGPISPSRIFWIMAWRATEWRHISPAASLRFLASAACPARRTCFTPPGSGANVFSMKMFTPFSTAYSRCVGRNAACVVKQHDVARLQAVDRLPVRVEAQESPVGRDVDLGPELVLELLVRAVQAIRRTGRPWRSA